MQAKNDELAQEAATANIEAEYKKLSPTPNEFPVFVKHVVAMASKPYDFGADNLKATKAPFFALVERSHQT